MEFGLFMELSVPRPWTPDSERQVYENALEQVRLADELGFDYIWAVEHHFLEEYSHCSGPDIFLVAAAATMTKRIRVGHGVVACVPAVPEPDPSGRAGGSCSTSSRADVWSWARGVRRRGPNSAVSAQIPTTPRRPGTSSSGSSPRCGPRNASAWNGPDVLHAGASRAAQAAPEASPADVGGGDVARHRDRRCRPRPRAVSGSRRAASPTRRRRSTTTAAGSPRVTRWASFVNDKVLTVNFLSCCEDGDRGRRNGLEDRIYVLATWRPSCSRPKRCCRRIRTRPRACCRRCGASRAVPAMPPSRSRA